MFFQMKTKPTLVCFRGSGLKLINTWYTDIEKSEEDERLRIVKAAATIIREDIRTRPYNTTDYPDVTDFMKNSNDDVPETLHTFLGLVRKGKARKEMYSNCPCNNFCNSSTIFYVLLTAWFGWIFVSEIWI